MNGDVAAVATEIGDILVALSPVAAVLSVVLSIAVIISRHGDRG